MEVNMIDFNTYQASLYKKLKEIKLDGVNQLSIYDKVQANAKLPFIIVGNYEFDEGEVKDYTYSITQNIEIWSDYQGKKEINSIVKLAIEKAKELASEELNDNYMIDAVTVMPSTVKEVEGFFNANLMVNFEIY
jgi:hypothetical protein